MNLSKNNKMKKYKIYNKKIKHKISNKKTKYKIYNKCYNNNKLSLKLHLKQQHNT